MRWKNLTEGVVVMRVDKEIELHKVAGKILGQKAGIKAVMEREHGKLTSVKEFKSNFSNRDVVIETEPSVALEMVRRGVLGIGFNIC